MKVYLESLGCCRNQIDSEVMLGRLESAGHEICYDPSEAQVILVNTCGFIASAEAEAVDTILELASHKKTGVCQRIVVTGCLPERFRDDTLTEALPEVDFFIGIGGCDEIVSAVENSQTLFAHPFDGSKIFLPDPSTRKFQGHPLPRHLTLNYSAYVKISEGCNRKCTYCIIPKLRGKQRSRSIDDITAETSYLIKKGVKEIILVGENTTDYGSDLVQPNTTDYGSDLVQPNTTDYSSNLVQPITNIGTLCAAPLVYLLEKVSECADKLSMSTPTTIWLRLLYTHPSSITKEVIAKIASFHNFCTYFDIPVQHASSKILKRMGRNYDQAHLYRLFESIKKIAPDSTLRTTLITGFPGETESDFKDLLKFVEEIKFDHLGVFVYSDSEDLASHHLKNHVSEEVKEERHDIIMAAQSQISEKINTKYVGQTLKVLVEENPDEGIYLGRTSFQAPEVDGITFIYGSGLAIGEFADVKITESYEYDLAGEK